MEKFFTKVPKAGATALRTSLMVKNPDLTETKPASVQKDLEGSLMKPSKLISFETFPSFEDFVDSLGSWKPLLKAYMSGPKFLKTYNLVKSEYDAKKKIYPPQAQIFNCFKHTTLENIKIVIVGQDPYHQPGQAMGLCFSVAKGTRTPPSLANMYKEISQDPKIQNFKIPKHGDLTKWADQGVLLLNTVLTVEDSKANSHKAFGWTDFTGEVIKTIDQKLENVIF
jgi:uracil-DNA glycosylase